MRLLPSDFSASACFFCSSVTGAGAAGAAAGAEAAAAWGWEGG